MSIFAIIITLLIIAIYIDFKMKKFIVIICVFCFIISAGGVYAQQALPQNVAMHRVQAGNPDQNGWYEARSTEGSFTVLLPVPFNDFTIKETDKYGKENRYYAIGGKSTEGVKFSVVEFNKENKNIDKDIDELLVNLKSTFTTIKERRFDFKGHPALEYEGLLPAAKTSGCQRVIYLPDKIFTMIIEYPTDKESKVKPLIKPFLDSLVF